MSSLLTAIGAPFVKMHGAGNDFVIFDLRGRDGAPPDAHAVADRRTGVGCDQVIMLEPGDGAVDAVMRIFNTDGSEAGACGNATRCVARILAEESGRESGSVATAGGRVLPWWRVGPGLWGVDMGAPDFDWARIPLAAPYDGDRMRLDAGGVADPTPVGMGNPHAVFFTDQLEDSFVITTGSRVETDAAFPDRVNVGFARIDARDRMRLRVWERGAGLTPACGSGACAALAAGVRRGLTDREATIALDGGELRLRQRDDDHIEMIGPAVRVFSGVIAGDRPEGAAAS